MRKRLQWVELYGMEDTRNELDQYLNDIIGGDKQKANYNQYNT